jgi:hypothetical protein
VPSAPTGVTATVKSHTVTVRWSAAATHGSPVTGYVVHVSPGTKLVKVAATKTTASFKLPVGTYTFTVTAPLHITG